jgi:hypothetical protein
MTSSTDQPELSGLEAAELSALADGTIDPARRAAVEARIAGSPELRALYERERGVVARLHEARVTDRAPARLRAAIEAQRPRTAVRVRRRAVYGGSLAGAIAAVVLALVLVLPGGTPGAPSVSQAAALALRGVAQPAPAPDPSDPRVKLLLRIQDLYFPNWSPALGWRAVGQRTDRINGRTAVTVFYEWRGTRIAYTILSSPAIAQPRASVTVVDGTVLRTLRMDGRLVVTWRRGSHTCVLSAGTGVTAGVLRELAAWKAPTEGQRSESAQRAVARDAAWL